ncbi:flavin reductase [Roseovarius rhodophyticola]|uniref:Flavin reductase n=1 Tax=Roseovarius rhodophyticola TaxID=3080827 RepID=A0ABZ2TAT4_9RHOB|nr:flavin reductase [Roseovarius sp. W115]MDV2930527.1 flavin reductase [Roseovarius sp. W115]
MAAQKDGERSDQRLRLRQAFGSFATGVTVVTSRTSEGAPVGFTANSFTSVSLEPPLLLVCLAKTSSNIGHFSQAGHFAVNILGEAQKGISNRFASRVPDRFADVIWRSSALKNPLIDGAVAWFDCETDNVVDAGDHVVLIGRIAGFDQTDGRPLAYLRGHYLDLGLAETAAESVSHHGGVRVGCLLNCQGQVLLRQTSEGWGLPMGAARPGFREGRTALEDTLCQSGIRAELGFLYSVFDAPSGNATWLIFHGDMEDGPLSDDLRLFPVQDLPLQDVTLRPVRSVLRRYQSEFREARFGLYVDGSKSAGQINPIDRNATPWSKLMNEQENIA